MDLHISSFFNLFLIDTQQNFQQMISVSIYTVHVKSFRVDLSAIGGRSCVKREFLDQILFTRRGKPSDVLSPKINKSTIIKENF